MNGRNIMFVGDSISMQLAISLMNVIMQETPGQPCNASESYYIKHPVSCSNTSYEDFIVYAYRNDRISLTPFILLEEKANFYEYPWIPGIAKDNIALLILNRGLHYEDDNKLLRGVNSTLSYLTEYHPELSIIWRNTVHGHYNVKNSFRNPPLRTPYTLAEILSEVMT